MLDSLRNLGRTAIGKVLMAFLIVGTAGFGISNVIFDFGANNVARVGEIDITTRDFQRAYNDQMNAIARQMGRLPTPQEAQAMGVPGMVLDRLSGEAALSQLGRTLGLGVSDDRLARMVAEDPTFAGSVGSFDHPTFVRVLQQAGFTEAEYFELQRNASRRQQVAAAVLADATLPDAAQRLVGRYVGDTRTIDYFVLSDLSIGSVPAPTEQELSDYLTANQDRFRTAETRSVEVLALTPEVLAGAIEITDEQIAAEYERTKGTRVTPERRTITQVPLGAAALPVFEAGLAAGRSFEELVAETGVTPTSLGTLSRNQVVDPNLARAAFELEEGKFTIIAGVGGRRAVYVSAVEGGGEVALDAVREQIRNELAMAQARRQHADVLDQIEELRAAFRPLTEIAGRFGLTLASLDVTASGEALSIVPGLAEGSRAQVASAIFAASEDRLPPTVTLGSTNHVWFDLKGVEPARDQTLDEVRDAVTAAWTAEKTAAALKAEADRMTAELDAGTAFADLAMANNIFPNLSQPLTRQGNGAEIDGAVAAAVFAGGEGHHGAARNAAGDYVVFEVVEVTPPAEPISAQAQEFVENSGQDTLFSAFVEALKQSAGRRVNEQALSQLLALDAGTGS